MEIQYPSFVVLFFSSLIFIKLITSLFKSTPNLPPGPRKLPLIGNIHNMVGDLPHRAMRQLALKYGPLMHLQLGEVPFVVVSSSEAAKQIMKTHDLNFSSRPPLLVTEIMTYNSTDIGFSPYGEYWRQLRKICALELLSAKRVQSMRSLREEEFFNLGRWISSRDGTPFNLTKKLRDSTYALISCAAVGDVTEEERRLVPIIQESIMAGAGFDIAELYPSVKLFRTMSSIKRRLTILHDEADAIFESIISKHKQATSLGQRKKEDLLDTLLKYQDGGFDIPLTNDNVKAVILDVLAGGTQTVTTTMTWAMAEMIKNPKVLKRAQQEVREFFDKKGTCIDESNLDELKYLKVVIKETLRLHSPLPLSIPRLCSETCEINGYQIPAKTKILINLWAINRDSNNWENADCFQPERFLDSDVDFKGNNFEFIPFGAGRRMCPGMTFGVATMQLPLSILLYHFDWALPAGESHHDMDMSESFGATAARLKDLILVPLTKRPLPLPNK